MDCLKDQPSPETIEKCIASTDQTSQVQLLQLVSLLLKHTIPEVFLDVPPSTQNAITQVFRTIVGLGNLLGRLAMIAKTRISLPESVPLLNAYSLLLDRVFTPNLLRQALATDPAKAQIYTREIDKLLFRGKAYSVMCEVALKFPNMHVPKTLESMDAYSRFLSKELLTIDSPAQFVPLLFSLGASLLNQFLDVMFCRKNLPFLVLLNSSLKRYERKLLIGKFLDFSKTLIPKDTIHEQKMAALSLVSQQVLDTKVWDELLLESAISKCDYSVNLLVALLIEDIPSLSCTLLRSWGNKTLMDKEPLVKQEFHTHLLACIYSQLSQHQLCDVLKSAAFMDAMSNRLMSHSNRAKAMGIILADELGKNAGQKPIFSIDVSEEVSISPVRITKAMLPASLKEAWDIILEPVLPEEVDENRKIREIENRFKPLAISRLLDEVSSDEEDPTLAISARKVPKPLYIRDLLAYLSVDTKEDQAYEKRKIALQTAPYLLKQRKGFGLEVSFFVEHLLSQLTGLSNYYEEDLFEQQKLNAMIAVVVSAPECTSHICHLLLTGDYSLQQRMCLLSAMALGARELRGYQRDGDASQHMNSQFPTKMLPEKLHRMYLSMDSEYSRIERSIQNLVMSEPSNQAQDQLMGGKVLRISSKLKSKYSKISEVEFRTLSREFGALVGKNFFFPLVAVWYESGGISIGHYTTVLVGHYIRSLSLILHSSYPISADIPDMTREYLNLVVPILQNVAPDQLQIIESAVTGLVVVLDINDDVLLMTKFGHMLSAAANAIQQMFELITEDRIKSLCAGYLYKMSALREKLERSLLDQTNGSFYS
ncbi:hypothetical protein METBISCDRAFT_17706 [Metschnikowia bicuspidata]|uniref:Telomere length regulation protein conserved domain-containing protein n=1 Tax=Metschnikowia bicuspidata TaxID=27322 RepID=A0A4P9ZCI9_9ASCO|nr:hypothetical protein METBISCDRAFT_17706 [Metschnikowia bicuspidata]